MRFSCGLIKTWGFYHRPQLIQLRTQHEELDEEQWLVYIEQQQKRVKAIQEVGHIPFMPSVFALQVFLSMPLRVHGGLTLGRRAERLKMNREFKGVLRCEFASHFSGVWVSDLHKRESEVARHRLGAGGGHA